MHLEGEGGGGVAYTTTTAYDDRNHTVSVTNPRGLVTVTRLDSLDRPVEQTVDPGGLALVTRTSYDGLGNRKAVTDAERPHHPLPLRRPRAARRDDRRRPAEGRRHLRRRGAEDDRDGPARHRAGASPTTTSAARAASPWPPLRSRASPGAGRRATATERQRIEIDARGHATTFDLDGLDRVVRETDALGHYRTFRWDGVNKRRGDGQAPGAPQDALRVRRHQPAEEGDRPGALRRPDGRDDVRGRAEPRHGEGPARLPEADPARPRSAAS